jgi:type IV fimbrial biogenesis protein FimT
MIRASLSSPARRPLGGFTLAELLVVIGVIATLSALTLVSVRAIARDARLASATNTVTAALGNARALAMKRNTPVLVAFYPDLDGTRSRVLVITAAATGDSAVADVVNIPWAGAGRPGAVLDRFRTLPDLPIRSLPDGIKIAGPDYAADLDGEWLVMTDLSRQPTEAPGPVVGVMYGADGTTLLSNSATDSDFVWIDRNDDGELERDGVSLLPGGSVDWFDLSTPVTAADEVVVNLVPFLAVFDDDEARRTSDPETWSDPAVRRADLSAYIERRADRIHFNRYTGVAMK